MTPEQQQFIKDTIAKAEDLGLAGFLTVQPKEEEKNIFTIWEIGSPKTPRPN